MKTIIDTLNEYWERKRQTLLDLRHLLHTSSDPFHELAHQLRLDEPIENTSTDIREAMNDMNVQVDVSGDSEALNVNHRDEQVEKSESSDMQMDSQEATTLHDVAVEALDISEHLNIKNEDGDQFNESETLSVHEDNLGEAITMSDKVGDGLDVSVVQNDEILDNAVNNVIGSHDQTNSKEDINLLDKANDVLDVSDTLHTLHMESGNDPIDISQSSGDQINKQEDITLSNVSIEPIEAMDTAAVSHDLSSTDTTEKMSKTPEEQPELDPLFSMLNDMHGRHEISIPPPITT